MFPINMLKILYTGVLPPLCFFSTELCGHILLISYISLLHMNSKPVVSDKVKICYWVILHVHKQVTIHLNKTKELSWHKLATLDSRQLFYLGLLKLLYLTSSIEFWIYMFRFCLCLVTLPIKTEQHHSDITVDAFAIDTITRLLFPTMNE